jgi:iron complex transport system permease protein
MNAPRPVLGLVTLVLVLLAVVGAAVFIGPTRTLDPDILWHIRLPRVLLGALVGFGLATAGALFQGLLKNPLADPYILGTSSGASLGVIAAFTLRSKFPAVFGYSSLPFYVLVFVFSFLATNASYLLARTQKQVQIVNLLLSGVMVNAFCGSLLMLFFSLQNEDTFSVFFFLLGSLMEGNWNLILTSAVIVGVSFIASLAFARDLNIISLGEEKAVHLGVEVGRLKLVVFALCALIVSASVAVSGTIGFVGLVAPHVTRLLIGPNHKYLIPASALGGAILMVVADAAARTVAAPIEIPVGVITAMVGAPFFLWLLRRKHKETVL